MSELIVLVFQDPARAQGARGDVVRLQDQELLAATDGALLVRTTDGRVTLRQLNELVGYGGLGGPFWGMLVGLLWYLPWLGLTPAAIRGVMHGQVHDPGIDEAFIEEVADAIRPGTSALLLFVEAWEEVEALEALAGTGATVLRTSLSQPDRARLEAAFGGGRG